MPMLAMAACGGETAPPAQEAGTAAPTEDAPAPTAMPEGARACRIEGWVIDRDPAGLNVRAAPARDAGVLGTLPPYVENGDGRGFGIPVHVQASLDGWFLIEAGDDDPDRTGGARRPVYSGQGWVAANMVRFSLQSGRGYARPDSGEPPIVDLEPDTVSEMGRIVRVHGCTGDWVDVEYRLERRRDLTTLALLESSPREAAIVHRGWFRGTCANQETNCDRTSP